MDIAWVIAWREVNGILSQRRMLIFAVGFGVVIPLLAGAGFVGVAMRLSSAVGLGTIGHLHATVHVTGLQGLVQSLLVWLGIFPILFSAQFAAVGFAAERERRSLPALLATPASLGAIVCGKLVATLLPGFVTVVGGGRVEVWVGQPTAPRRRVAAFGHGPLGGALPERTLAAGERRGAADLSALTHGRGRVVHGHVYLAAGQRGHGALRRRVGDARPARRHRAGAGRCARRCGPAAYRHGAVETRRDIGRVAIGVSERVFAATPLADHPQ